MAAPARLTSPSAAEAFAKAPNSRGQLGARTPSISSRSNRPAYNQSRLAPYPNYQRSSRQSNVIQDTIDEDFETVYSNRGTDRVDTYIPPPDHRERDSWRPVTNKSQRSYQGEGQTREYGHKLDKSEFKPGVVIRAVLHEQDFRGATTMSTATYQPDTNTTKSQYGLIYTKVRHMIVVACFEAHYIAIPLFTHNGNGLRGKNPEEYISFKDHRSNLPFQALTRHGVLLTEFISSKTQPFHTLSTAHFTYPLSRKYTLPVYHEGHLQLTSTKKLITLFKQYSPK